MSEATFRYAVYGLVIDPGSLPLARAMAWPQTWMWAVSLVFLLFFLPLYFPDGHLLSPRWRLALWLAFSYSAAALIYFAVLPGQVSDVASVSNPLGIEALRPVMGVMDVIMTVSFLVIVLCSVASLVAGFRRSRGEQRQQMKWLTSAAGAKFARCS